MFIFILLFNSWGIAEVLDISKFSTPFCMIGNGSQSQSEKKKVEVYRWYQRKIDRSAESFVKNKKLERRVKLYGSAKWVVNKYMDARKYNSIEKDFIFFAMTLFGEARNLASDEIEMVARVINYRKEVRGYKNYQDTVTALAQFSVWYYRNQLDNVVMLCPSEAHNKSWIKVLRVAADQFNREDNILKSTHYFAPRNMNPKYKVPYWAKGRFVVRYGLHLFIIDKDTYDGDKEVIYIDEERLKFKI